jgi:hypothetical protein
MRLPFDSIIGEVRAGGAEEFDREDGAEAGNAQRRPRVWMFGDLPADQRNGFGAPNSK